MSLTQQEKRSLPIIAAFILTLIATAILGAVHDNADTKPATEDESQVLRADPFG